MRSLAASFNAALAKAKRSVDVYLYLVENSRCLNFDGDLSGACEAYDTLCSLYQPDASDYLQVHSVEDYCKYFYTTDTHWNYLGSYTGYKQILMMLRGDRVKPLKPIETVKFPVLFNGKYANLLNETVSNEYFTVYRFNLPKMTVYVDGKKGVYGHQQQYFNGKYSTKEFFAHYSYFYGGINGLVHFMTNREKLPTLLIIGNSQSSAVKHLLLNNYNEIYCIDIRSVDEALGCPFSLAKYIKEWEIDQVLWLGDIHLFMTDYTFVQ